MSYLGPHDMELDPPTDETPAEFVITPGVPLNLRRALIAKINPGDWLAVTTIFDREIWHPPMEVYDTDGEGSILWNRTTAEDETTAALADLDNLLETGHRVKVMPQ